MIVSLSVTNFRSFCNEVTFSLVASKELAAHPAHTIPIPDSDERVLKTAVLYGANGAGKSNVLKALDYVRDMVLDPPGKGQGTGREPFRFGDPLQTTSDFDLLFIADNRLYRFGFKVNDDRITEEWLVRVIGSEEKVVYERETSPEGHVTLNEKAFQSEGEKLQKLTAVGGLQNRSFLATVRDTLEEPEYGETLGKIFEWFRVFSLVKPSGAPFSLGRLLIEEGFKKFAGGFLKKSSTGVDHLTIETTPVDEGDITHKIPDSLRSKVVEGNGFITHQRAHGKWLIFDPEIEIKPFLLTLKAGHNCSGKNIPIAMEWGTESDGTRRLLELIAVLYKMQKMPSVYFIDEIDRSLHPELVREFLSFFLKSATTPPSQLILTTHESNLLDLDLLRRDEIWFAEKDLQKATNLYSLSDFKIHKDSKGEEIREIRQGYLQGRFGAIPFLGGLDRLLSQRASKNG